MVKQVCFDTQYRRSERIERHRSAVFEGKGIWQRSGCTRQSDGESNQAGIQFRILTQQRGPAVFALPCSERIVCSTGRRHVRLETTRPGQQAVEILLSKRSRGRAVTQMGFESCAKPCSPTGCSSTINSYRSGYVQRWSCWYPPSISTLAV